LVQASDAIRGAGRVLVTEGYMDVVALAQFGVGYAVATLGTATTPVHVAKLLRLTDEVVFCFDGDAAGRKAAWRALEVSLPMAPDHKPVRFLFLPEGEDPDTYVRGHGRESFEELVRQAQTLSGFLIGELRAQSDLATAEGRSRFLATAKPYVQKISASALRLQVLKEIADLGRVSQEEAERLMDLRSAPMYRSSAPAKSRPPATASQERNLLACVLARPELAAEVDLELLDSRLAETAALRAIASLRRDAGALSEAALIEQFQGTGHAEVVFEAQASALKGNMTAEMAEEQFRQIALALRIRRKNEEYEALKQKVSSDPTSRELMAELDRRMRELAELRAQRL
jgi:DNA primase